MLTEYNEKKELEKIGKEHFEKGWADAEKTTIFRLFSLGYTNPDIKRIYQGKYSNRELSKFRKEWEKNSN